MKKIIFCFAAIALMGLLFASCEREDIDSTTPGGGGNNTSQDTPSGPGEWVDLGLPSGLLWYSCNLGATTPEGFGDYYAWGETQTKSRYTWDNYIYGDCEVDGYTQTYSIYKYNVDPHYGTVDNLLTLQASDDAARALLGNSARIPTKEDYEELARYTTHEWDTTQNGVKGRVYYGSNGNTIFLPATGSWGNTSSAMSANFVCRYWLSTLDTTGWTSWSDTVPQYYKNCYCAYCLEFNSCGDILTSEGNMVCPRYDGRAIRPVKAGNNK